MTLNVATYSQILTILTQLATNYTNIFTEYYNFFYSDIPMDITLQVYTEDGTLQTITVPNRAKDRQFILNGSGDPNGVITALKGSLYQDTSGGSTYLNLTGSIDGWSKLVSNADLSSLLRRGTGSPEGVEVATTGTLYLDGQNAALYIKTTATGNTGWNLISATTTVLANTDLSNLTEEGEGHFANLSLSNLDDEGISKISNKENVNNKVTVINSSSTNTQYPSAKAVYDLVGEGTGFLANKDLSNLTSAGDEKFIQSSTQARDCIFKAPNGILSEYNGVLSFPAGTVLLCTDGVGSDHNIKNIKVSVANSLTTTVVFSSAVNGVVFYNHTSGTLIYYDERYYFRQDKMPTGEVNMIWYNPNTNTYQITSNSGNTWTTILAAEIGRFTTDNDGVVDSFNPYHPMTVAMEDDIRVLKTYINQIIETLPVIEYYEGEG